MLNKIYAGLGILAIVLAGIFYIIHLRSELKTETKLKEDALFSAWVAEEGQRLANEAHATLLKKQKAIKDERDKLNTCIANGTCGVQLNAVCDQASSDSNGIRDGVPRLTPTAQQGLLDTRDGIDHNAALYQTCLQTLRNWKGLLEGKKK